MSVRISPGNARRGGLVILGAGVDDGQCLARLYADAGFETILGDRGDDPSGLVGKLSPPVFILALPDAAVAGWAMTGVAAASIVADERAAGLVSRPPAGPAVLHLDPSTHDGLAAAFEADQPDLPVHRLSDTDDGERLLHLRTLRLFAAHAGGRGEA